MTYEPTEQECQERDICDALFAIDGLKSIPRHILAANIELLLSMQDSVSEAIQKAGVREAAE